jgi:hypothetical protein
VYRPFALLAFTATVAGGTPLGIWLLWALYLHGPAVSVGWRLLHAHLQIFGFFATLILGVAHHLLPRFTGRPVTRGSLTRPLAVMVGAAVALRVLGTAAERPVLLLVAALLQTVAFVLFGWWVWRSLDPPPLALVRRQLALSTGWLAFACALEAALRLEAAAAGVGLPDLDGMRAVHAIGIFGGVIGWMLGVLLRAGPMFVPRWSVPPGLARLLPWTLALGASLSALGEAGDWTPSIGAALARLGELISVGAVLAVATAGGAWRRAPAALPTLGRSPAEARIFRLALVCAAATAAGSAVASAVVVVGMEIPLLPDVLRHLLTIGFLTSVVVAMGFRLIPVLEQTPLPWPALRVVAFWALVAAVVLRSAALLVGAGWRGVGLWVVLSGPLAWIALACVSANMLGAIAAAARRRGAR